MKQFVAGVVLAVCLLVQPAFAQSLLPKGDSSQPIDIAADRLEVLQKDKLALFSGKVEAKQGNVRLKADEMRVHYREKAAGEQNGVSKIDVNGHVFLATPQETVQGAKGVYNVDKGLITLEGSVVITRGKNVLKGNGLTYDINTGRSALQGGGTESSSTGGGRVRGIFVPEKKN